MKSKAIILLIFLLVIAASFVAQKSSARQSAKIKDTTGIAPSVSVRERFLGTWELVSTEYRYSDGTRAGDDAPSGCRFVAGLYWLPAAAAVHLL